MSQMVVQFLLTLIGSALGSLLAWHFIIVPSILRLVAREVAQLNFELGVLESKLAIFTGSKLFRCVGNTD